MKKILLLLVIIIAAAGYLKNGNRAFFNLSEDDHNNHTNLPTNINRSVQSTDQSDSKLQQLFKNRQSNVQIKGSGKVYKILADDLKGSKHQRFILKMNSGQTLLIAHNIDLAKRIPSLSTGDSVEFFGEYEWNSKGGLLHWTHHDPAGRHIDGWLKHKSVIYQ